MKRMALFLVLLCAYGVFAERRFASGGVRRFDALAPRAREVERAIADKRFADALPLAIEMRDAAPNEALVALWLTAIYRGLDRPADEADAWERFIALGKAGAEACPGVAEAYARIGDQEGLRGYERCARLDPTDPERFVDLAKAFERAGRPDEAADAYRRVADLDPTHPLAPRDSQPSQGKAGQP